MRNAFWWHALCMHTLFFLLLLESLVTPLRYDVVQHNTSLAFILKTRLMYVIVHVFM